MKRWLCLLLLLCTSCVRIGLGEGVVIAEEPLENKRAQILSKRVRVTVDQDDTTITIVAERVCDVEERARIQTTTERERVNLQPGVTWQLGIYGAILAGVGTGVIVDAQLNVEESELDGQGYNPIGPTGATAIGAAFLAAASPMLIIALVDGIRATGTEDEVSEVYQSKGVIEKNTTCLKRVPVASAKIVGETRKGTKLMLGQTDAEGVLEVELAEAVPEKVTIGEGALSLALFLGKHRFGMADLKPVVAMHHMAKRDREDKEWESLDVAACEKGSATECHAIEEFLKRNPHSPHAPAGRAALQKGNAVIASRQAADKQKRDRDAAAAAAAAEERRRQAERARACRARCASGCSGNQQCVNACVAAKCR